MQDDTFIIADVAIHPTQTDSSSIRESLKDISTFYGYAPEIDSILNIMELCRLWLPVETGTQLCMAALQHNDAIYQVATHYSPARLPAQVRSYANLDTATDVQAIAAFTLASAMLALSGLGEHLQSAEGQEIPALEYYRMHLECISECAPGASAWLAPDENEACCEMGERAYTASKLAENKINGILSGITRRKELASRNRAIIRKALELYRSGTPSHNLNSKLRAWQLRETGKALSKVQMGEILKPVEFRFVK